MLSIIRKGYSMQDDLGTIAENALNEIEAADAGNDTPPTPPEGGDDAQDDQPPADDTNNDNTPTGGENDDVEESEASEDDDQGEDDGSKKPPVEDEPGADDEPKGKQAQELTDDELLAELEKRGKKPAEKPADDEAKPAPRPAEVPEDVWGAMNDFQRTVYEKLPYLEARGKDGTVLRVKSHQQIPADFEWISPAAERQFYNIDMPAQSVQAERIGGQLQGQSQQQRQQQQFQEEANMVVKGIDALQAQGIVPKITAQPNTPEFNNDPGVQRANQILTLRNEYLARGENISIETAGRIFKAENPDLYVTKPTKSPADAERKAASRNISGSGGRGTANDAKKGGDTKPKVWPVGTSAEDIADAYADQLD